MIAMIAAFTELFFSTVTAIVAIKQTKLKNDNFRADGKP